MLLPGLRLFKPDLADKVDHEDFSNFSQINFMMDLLESQIHIANETQNRIKFVVARNFDVGNRF